MARNKVNGPTEKELAILNVLWNLGPSTVRQVNDEINKSHKTGYTTTLKLMQIMAGKKLLERDESEVKHIYQPVANQDITQKQLVGDLLERAFSGSSEKLVMHALSAKKVSAKELAKIKNMINKIEEK